jgi:hypothetical protein
MKYQQHYPYSSSKLNSLKNRKNLETIRTADSSHHSSDVTAEIKLQGAILLTQQLQKTTEKCC